MSVNITRLVIITFLSRAYFYIHINTLYLQSRGLDLLQVASLESIIVATIFLAEVPTGILADRIGRKWSVVLALAFQTVGEVLYLFGQSYAAYAFIAVLAGVGFAFSSGASEALVYDSLPTEGRDDLMKRAMGRIGSAGQLAFFISPLIGGLLVTQLVPDAFFRVIFLTALAVGVGLFVSLTLREPPVDSADDDNEDMNTLAILANGLRVLRENASLRHIVAISVLTLTVEGTIVTLYQPRFVEVGIPPVLIGVGLSMGALVGAVAQYNAYRLENWFGARWGLTVAIVLPGVLMMILGAVGMGSLVFMTFVLAYGLRDMRTPLLSAYQNRHIASRYRATTLSLVNMLLSLYSAGVGLCLGALALGSVQLALFFGGALVIVFSVLTRPDLLKK